MQLEWQQSKLFKNKCTMTPNTTTKQLHFQLCDGQVYRSQSSSRLLIQKQLKRVIITQISSSFLQSALDLPLLSYLERVLTRIAEIDLHFQLAFPMLLPNSHLYFLRFLAYRILEEVGVGVQFYRSWFRYMYKNCNRSWCLGQNLNPAGVVSI